MIYWADAVSRSGTIRVGTVDGTSVRTLFAGESYPVGVAIDPAAGKIYWGSYDTFKIRVGNLNGTGASDLFTGENYPTQLAIDTAAGKLYWTNEFAGNVRVGNLDGTGARTLYGGEGDVGGVAIDPTAGKVYWTNWNLGTVRVGSLDGTAPAQSLYTGETDPWMLALLRAPLGTGAPQVSGVASVGQTLTCGPASWAADLLSGFLYRAPQSVAYQWTVGGVPIAGATASSVLASSPGDYRCEVIATNAAGSTTQTSAPFTVSVSAPSLPPPRLGRAGGRRTGQRQGVRGHQRPVGAAVQRDADPVGHRNRCASRDDFSNHCHRERKQDADGNVQRRDLQDHAGESRSEQGLTTLTLINNAFKGAPSYASCKSRRALDASAAAVSSRTLQLLHASAHGKFRTRGRYSAATVRGTKWTIAERCDGTLVRDITDSLAVTDFVRHKTLILHAGQRYLA